MKRTSENALACGQMVRAFEHMRFSPSNLTAAMEDLTETLLAACTSIDVAKDVVRTVKRNEEVFPTEATIRKYIRLKDYKEEDIRAEEDAKTRRQIEKQKEMLRGEQSDDN